MISENLKNSICDFLVKSGVQLLVSLVLAALYYKIDVVFSGVLEDLLKGFIGFILILNAAAFIGCLICFVAEVPKD